MRNISSLSLKDICCLLRLDLPFFFLVLLTLMDLVTEGEDEEFLNIDLGDDDRFEPSALGVKSLEDSEDPARIVLGLPSD